MKGRFAHISYCKEGCQLLLLLPLSAIVEGGCELLVQLPLSGIVERLVNYQNNRPQKVLQRGLITYSTSAFISYCMRVCQPLVHLPLSAVEKGFVNHQYICPYQLSQRGVSIATSFSLVSVITQWFVICFQFLSVKIIHIVGKCFYFNT